MQQTALVDKTRSLKTTDVPVSHSDSRAQIARFPAAAILLLPAPLALGLVLGHWSFTWRVLEVG